MLLLYKDITRPYSFNSILDNRLAVSMPLYDTKSNYYGDNTILRRSSRNLTSSIDKILKGAKFICPHDCSTRYKPRFGQDFSTDNCIFMMQEKIINGQSEIFCEPFKLYDFSEIKSLELISVVPFKNETQYFETPAEYNVNAPAGCMCLKGCAPPKFQKPSVYYQ